MNIWKGITVSAAFLVLAACQTNEAFYGNGPLTLSNSVLQGFERYKNAGYSSGYFAVTEDGRGYSFSYCSAAQCGGSALMVAIRSCESRTQRTCKIYAEGKQVVWDHTAQRSSK